MNTQQTWTENPALLDAVAERAESELASIYAESKSYLRMYYDRPVVGGVEYNRPYRELAVYQALKEAAGGNLTREVVDAATSVVCRQMAADVMPVGDDFKLEQGCKQASRLIEGVFDNGDFLGVAKRCAKDGMTAHVGPCKAYVDPATDEIKFERLNPLEYWWLEDGTREPRTRGTISPASRDVLLAQYPKHAARIKDLPSWAPPVVMGVDATGTRRSGDVQTVRVVEAWCAALGEHEPGRHTIVAGDLVLEDEAWPHDTAPVFVFRWQEDFRGHAGVPLARIVARYAAANNRLLRMVYAGLQGAVPKLLVHEDANIEGVGDVEFEKVTWSGVTPPQFVMPQTVSPEIIGQIEKNYARAYAEAGVNQNMATGSAPARYSSGAAQREFVDIANTRLLDAHQQWMAFWRDAAKAVVMLAQQARRANVRVKGANYYQAVTFPKLPADKYRVSFGLSSGLSLTPAGRLDDLERLQAMQVIDQTEVMRASVDVFPDIRKIAERVTAPRDLVMRQISDALEDCKFSTPSAMQGPQLQVLVDLGTQEYQRAMWQGTYPRENMECLRRLIRAAQARITPPPAPPPANDNGVPVEVPTPEQAPAPMPAEQPAPPAMAVA